MTLLECLDFDFNRQKKRVKTSTSFSLTRWDYIKPNSMDTLFYWRNDAAVMWEKPRRGLLYDMISIR